MLCEKPLAPSYPLALEMTEAAKKAGVVTMVNLRYRELSVMQMARALVEDGMVGEIRHIDAAYLQSWLVGTHWGDWRTEERWLWRLSGAHGSRGVLGDVGIHILDFASYVADQKPVSVHCRMKTFGKAEGDRIGAYGLDANDSFVMSIEFDGGAIGVVHASRWMTGYANAMKLGVFGTQGALEIWFESEKMGMRVCAGAGRAHADLARRRVPAGAEHLRDLHRRGAPRRERRSRAFAAPPSCSTCSTLRSSSNESGCWRVARSDRVRGQCARTCVDIGAGRAEIHDMNAFTALMPDQSSGFWAVVRRESLSRSGWRHAGSRNRTRCLSRPRRRRWMRSSRGFGRSRRRSPS